LGHMPVLVRRPTTLPGGTVAPAGGSWATTTALLPWGSPSMAAPRRPPVRSTRSARARVRPRTSGTPYPRVFPGAVRMAGAGLGPVAGDRALEVIGNRRPTTTRTPTPSTTAAAVANRLDDPRMLSSTDAVWWFLIIVTDAAGGRMVHRHEPPLAAVLLRRGTAGPAAHGNAALLMAHETPGDSRAGALPSPVCTAWTARHSHH
jgi:hypothetical protein